MSVHDEHVYLPDAAASDEKIKGMNMNTGMIEKYNYPIH